MSYFKAEKHQIRFRLGLHPTPRWESFYSVPSDPIAGSKGAYFIGDGKRVEGRKRKTGIGKR